MLALLGDHLRRLRHRERLRERSRRLERLTLTLRALVDRSGRSGDSARDAAAARGDDGGERRSGETPRLHAGERRLERHSGQTPLQLHRPNGHLHLDGELLPLVVELRLALRLPALRLRVERRLLRREGREVSLVGGELRRGAQLHLGHLRRAAARERARRLPELHREQRLELRLERRIRLVKEPPLQVLSEEGDARELRGAQRALELLLHLRERPLVHLAAEAEAQRMLATANRPPDGERHAASVGGR